MLFRLDNLAIHDNVVARLLFLFDAILFGVIVVSTQGWFMIAPHSMLLVGYCDLISTYSTNQHYHKSHLCATVSCWNHVPDQRVLTKNKFNKTFNFVKLNDTASLYV